MRKIYKKPSLSCINLQTEEFLAASVQLGDQNGPTMKQKDAWSKRKDMWGKKGIWD